MTRRNDHLVGAILCAIQRESDRQGNVTMIGLAEAIARDLCELDLLDFGEATA